MLLHDLKLTAKKLGKQYVTYLEYDRHGRFSAVTLYRRFGGWNNTLAMAGLVIGKNYRIQKPDLLDNLKKVWDKLKRQPVHTNMEPPLSLYSCSSYVRAFGSWHAALKAFIKHIEAKSFEGGKSSKAPREKLPVVKKTCKKRIRTSRAVGKGMRFDILKRDNYKCRLCGASPAINPKVTLHVDHIVPYSKGGETKPHNLQTLCSDCNLGKAAKSINN